MKLLKSQPEKEPKKALDLKDYNEWRVRPEVRKQYIKPTKDDFKQEIEYTWLFVLSLPTIYFLAFVTFYYQHLTDGHEY